MTVTTEHAHDEGPGREGTDGGGAERAHHETPEHRHRKEHLALWLFIGGDIVFVALTIFTWIYTRSLNTNGMWRGANCTRANPCTNGLGGSITHEIPTASPWYGVVIALLIVLVALLAWSTERSARSRAGRGVIAGWAGLAILALLAAIVVQCYEFGVLPFTTIDGTYASSFEFVMGSTLVHVLVLGFIAFGVWNRARAGRYDEGRWYQTRLFRIFSVWVALSVCALTLVASVFT